MVANGNNHGSNRSPIVAPPTWDFSSVGRDTAAPVLGETVAMLTRIGGPIGGPWPDRWPVARGPWVVARGPYPEF